MIAQRSSIWSVTTIAALAIGCAQVPKAVESAPDSEKPGQRQSELLRDYEQRRDLVQYQAAMSKAQQGDAAGAKQTLDLLLERSPSHRMATLLASEIALELQDPQQAYQLARPLVERDAGDARAQHALGLALEGLGQAEQAKQHFSEALRLDPTNAVFQASNELANIHDAWVANSHTAKSGTADRADYDGHARVNDRAPLQAGHLAAGNGMLDTAMKHYSTAMAQAPDNPDIPQSAALKMLQLNETAHAIELLSHGCRQFPHSIALLRTLATAHYRQGEYESSQVSLQQALSLDNTDALTYFLLGAVREKLGDQQGSAASIARARQLDSTLPRRR